MIIRKMMTQGGAVLLVACAVTLAAFARADLAVSVPDDGTVPAARQCDVYVSGTARSVRPDPLRYRWLAGTAELTAWSEVRADRSAPLDLCGLPAGRHRLTLEVTDGARTVSDTMTATIEAAPSLVASRVPADR